MITIAWISLVMAMAVIFAISYYGSVEITRIPYFAVPHTPHDFGWPSETVAFHSEDGTRLTGWFIPAETPSSTTVIVQHGIGSNAGDMLLSTSCLRKGGWNLFYFNFRGHADSEGRYTSLGPLELLDLQAAVKFLRQAKAEQSKRFGIYGFSLGAAVAIVGAARMEDFHAVAVESPFAVIKRTIRHFARLFYGIPYFPFIPLALFITSLRMGTFIGTFAPMEEIRKISPRPLFLIQAGRDLRMPQSDAEALWEAAGEPKERWVVPGADHGEPWLIYKEEYERRLLEFFRKALS